ncbi:MAG: PQQ-binding-like beta-propeller repeat protein [Verrucomicrobiota bacterium]|nr:PQQ-binding-like beta-propeller repeat protein [Verrucomicrobiota bacterium]
MNKPFIHLSALVLLAGTLNADNYWSRFRGPNGRGVISGGNPPVKLDVDTHLSWKVPIQLGHSSPVTWGDRLFLTSFKDNTVFTHSFSRIDGTIEWSRGRSYNGPRRGPGFADLHEDTNPAAATPCVDADRVYAYCPSIGLTSYDHQGNEIWHHAFPNTPFLYGTGGSPMVHRGIVFLLRDSLKKENSMLYAFDAKTGERKWKTARPFSNISYCTPSILQTPLGDEVVTLGAGRLSGYAAETGKELWSLDGMGKSSINLPIVQGDELFINAKIMLGFEVDYNYKKAWEYILSFDQNNNNVIEETEITKGIRMPQRPDLPLSSPGFGYVMNPPSRFKSNFDLNNDGRIPYEEFVSKIDSMTREMQATQARVQIVREEGKSPMPKLVWSERRFLPEIPSILPYGDRVYAVLNGGFFVSRNATTGELVEKDRLNASGMYAASPVAANHHIYFASRRGVVTVMKADDTFDIISSTQLDGEIYATPAIQDDLIYFRTTKWLYAFRQ